LGGESGGNQLYTKREKRRKMTCYIADSAVFIMGNCDLDSSLMITVPSVADELKSRDSVLRFDLAKEGGLRVEWPEPEMVKEVRKMAEHTRDSEELSKTDLEILAKALNKGKGAYCLRTIMQSRTLPRSLVFRLNP
jgi:UPF0271 protein